MSGVHIERENLDTQTFTKRGQCEETGSEWPSNGTNSAETFMSDFHFSLQMVKQ